MSVAGNPFSMYREVQVKTAAPDVLLLMVYDGAINFLQVARAKIEEKNVEGAHNSLLRAQALIGELMASLRVEIWEGASNLLALYEYMIRRLMEANFSKVAEPVTEVISLLSELRDAWAQAAREYRKGLPKGGGLTASA